MSSKHFAAIEKTSDAADGPSKPATHQALLQRKCACGGSTGPGGECAECRKNRVGLQRYAVGRAASAIPPVVEESLRSPGQPLDLATRAFMESRFGHDFSQVRVHSDGSAATAARVLEARAFTVGSDIVFAAGLYDPRSEEGRTLLVHELTHVLQQASGAVTRFSTLEITPPADPLEQEADAVARSISDSASAGAKPLKITRANRAAPSLSMARFKVGQATVEINYGNLISIAAADFEGAIEARFETWTGSPASIIHAELTALGVREKEWMLFALDLLVDNPVAGLDKVEAVRRLIAYAPSARFRALGNATGDFSFENEALMVSGWFEKALTSSLAAPTGARLREVQRRLTPGGAAPGSSSCPSPRPANEQLDTARLQSDLPTQLETYLNSIAPPSSLSVQPIATLRPIADIIQEEAVGFFAPYANRARGRGNLFLQQWQYSANLVASHSPAAAPDQDKRLAYLDSRARTVGNQGLFAQVNYDPRCAADEAVLEGIVQSMESRSAISNLVDRILQQISYTVQSATPKQVVLNVQFDPHRKDECDARWRIIENMCHELVHVMVHDDFRQKATGRQILVEGFTEILGDQLYNSLARRARSEATFKSRLEAGLNSAPCSSIPSSTTGYGPAGQQAEQVRVLVGNDRFRAAYFLGQLELVGIQPKLYNHSSADPLEAEADRIAEQVVREPGAARFNAMALSLGSQGADVARAGALRLLPSADSSDFNRVPDNTGGRKMPTHAANSISSMSLCFGGNAGPLLAREVLNSPGLPLDAATRAFLEPRLGIDFSRVRVHTDARASESARALQAQAYTLGRDIVFADGQYNTTTQEGRRLLAHELAHVAQQASLTELLPIQYKKKKGAPKPPFFQQALDELEETEKADVVKLSTGGKIDMFGRVPLIKKFIVLAEAIDKEHVEAIPDLMEEFIESDTKRLPVGFPCDALVNTTVTRLLLLGLGEQAESFRRWYLKHEQETTPPLHQRKDMLSERFIWEQVLDELINQIPAQGADAALKVLDALLLLFRQMADQAAGLDGEAIVEDRRRIGELESLIDLPFARDVSISVYFDALVGLLKQAYIGIQTAYQVALDQAIADLSAGRGDKYLKLAKDRLENKLRGPLELVLFETKGKKAGEKGQKIRVAGLTTEVTRSEFKKGGGKHMDFFAKGKAAEKRSVEIEFYDQEMLAELASEKEMNFARIFLIRREQILVLERTYGLETDKQGKPTAETKENAAAIARLGKKGLRLESDDDWRRFLLEKFEERKAKSNATEALTAVIKLLESFLHAFTTHTPYNIEDFGDNLLTKQFPRALTGQLIHDCGVYALRIAYMLSLLRDHPDLQLRFRFIVLPVHVGLIITGKGLPLYIAHNDQIVIFSAKDVAEIRKAWIETDEQGNPRQPTGKDEEEQFVAELAGAEFVPGVDLPFKLLEVPRPKGDPEAIKRDLWSFYTKRVAPVELFGPDTKNPKSPLYQFHLEYLKTLDMIKEHYNNHLVPFWNDVAHPAWLKHEPGLSKALARLKAATGKEQQAARKAFDELVARYTDAVKPAFDVVDEKFGPVLVAQVEILQVLRDHPEVIGKGVPLTHSARIEEIIRTPWWSREFFDHLSILISGQEVKAPFARKENLLWPID